MTPFGTNNLAAMESGSVTVLKSQIIPDGKSKRTSGGLAIAYQVDDLLKWVAEYDRVPDGFRRIVTTLSVRPVFSREDIVEFSWRVVDASRELDEGATNEMQFYASAGTSA